MQHPERWAEIEAYADGMLPAPRRAGLQTHLDSCVDCAGYFESVVTETTILSRAFAPTAPPDGFVESVLAALPPRKQPALWIRSGFAPGVFVSALIGVILLLISLGSGVSLAPMLLILLVAVILWGGAKGFAFARLSGLLPGGILARGALFALGLWVLTTAVLALLGGFGAQASFAPSFLLVGSAVHDLVYGVLLSALQYRLSTGPRRPGPVLPARRASATLAILALPVLTLSNSRHLHQIVPTATPTATETGTPLTATPTVTATPTAAVSPTSTSTAAATVTVTATGTAVPPATAHVPTAAPSPTPTTTPRTSKKSPSPAAKRQRPINQQLRAILPAVASPQRAVTPTERTRDLLVLLKFL